MARLRPPLKTITFIGMMFNSSNADLKHFFNATKSLVSAVRRQAAGQPHQGARAVPPRRASDQRQCAGGAAGEVRARSRHSDPHRAPSARSCCSDRRPASAAPWCARRTASPRIAARRGVVLACGGFPHDVARITQGLPASAARRRAPVARARGQHGRRPQAGRSAGGSVDIRFKERAAAWMPVSRVPHRRRQVRRLPAPARPLQARHHRRAAQRPALHATSRTRTTTSARR